jgi:hypothetical protein
LNLGSRIGSQSWSDIRKSPSRLHGREGLFYLAAAGIAIRLSLVLSWVFLFDCTF